MITLEIYNIFIDHEKHSISYLHPLKKDLISSTQSFQLKVSSKASKIILDPTSLIIRKMHIKITMKQGTKASALGQPRGLGGGGMWEGVQNGGTHVYLWPIHVDVWQKPSQYCKVIILQLK